MIVNEDLRLLPDRVRETGRLEHPTPPTDLHRELSRKPPSLRSLPQDLREFSQSRADPSEFFIDTRVMERLADLDRTQLEILDGVVSLAWRGETYDITAAVGLPYFQEGEVNYDDFANILETLGIQPADLEQGVAQASLIYFAALHPERPVSDLLSIYSPAFDDPALAKTPIIRRIIEKLNSEFPLKKPMSQF